MIEDSVIIVTGGGRGIGKATALNLADHGANVVVNDLGVDVDGTGSPNETPLLGTVAEIEDSGGTAVGSAGDVTDSEYVRGLIESTVEEFDRLDGVANFAGIMDPSVLTETDEETWNRVIDVHLSGHFNLLHHAGRHWRDTASDDGLDRKRSFVSVTSTAALGIPGANAYAAAKAGVLGVTRTAAIEFHRYDVCVNALLPSGVTRMVPDEFTKHASEDEHGPDRVAPLAVALLSDETAVTGWTFAIGGDTVYAVSDPSLTTASRTAGGWSAEGLAAEMDFLTRDGPTEKIGTTSILDLDVDS